MTDFEQLVWRLDLPDDLEPVGFWCVCITIPAGQQYMDSLTAALGMLTLSKSWARDPTGDGAITVAHTWENALYMNPFTVQEDCIVISPPVITGTGDAADWSAGIIQLFSQHIIGELNTCAVGPGDCAGCVDSLMTELAPYGATDSVRGILAKLCDDLNNLTGPQRAAYETDCPYLPQFADLKTKIADNPYDWLNKLSDWLFSFLNSTADTILQDISITAALLGGNAIGQFVNDHGGAGGGAGFGSTCPWHAHIDFTGTDGGFVPVQASGSLEPEAVWISGTGWGLTVSHDTGGDNYNGQCSMRLTTTPFDLISISFVASLHVGTDTNHLAPLEQVYNGAVNASYFVTGDGITFENTVAQSGSALLQFFSIASTEHGSTPADPGTAVCTTCDVIGSGTVPPELVAFIV